MLPSKSIIEFYSGQYKGASRTLEEIWHFNDDELEGYHTYIQWLFPLKEPSGINFAAPVVDADVMSAFRTSPQLRQNLLTSFNVMLKFYGFDIVESGNTITVDKSFDYGTKKENWISHRNHNYLRITRILMSLRLLGLEEYSNAFFACLEKVYADESYEIGEESFGYWKRTQSRPVE